MSDCANLDPAVLRRRRQERLTRDVQRTPHSVARVLDAVDRLFGAGRWLETAQVSDDFRTAYSGLMELHVAWLDEVMDIRRGGAA